MIPRSVLQQNRKKQQQRKTERSSVRHLVDCCPLKSDQNYNVTNDAEVEKVVEELVNKCSSGNQSPSTCFMHSRPRVLRAISCQSNPPLVDVGPLAPSNRIPVYKRCVSATPCTRATSESVYTGLAWEPCRPKSGKHSEWRGKHSVPYQGRYWELTETGKYYLQRPDRHRGFVFTVMSYNVLAQDLLEMHSNMYYGPCEYQDWMYRSCRLLHEIKHHMPDILCLQEVQHNHYAEFFQPELNALGYDGTYLKRTADKTDGCATFHRMEKFRTQEIIEVPYLHQYGGDVLNRDNVGLIVKLQPVSASLAPDKALVVANTHLLFNPRRGDIKLAQLMMLFAEIDKCAYITHDMNWHMYQPLIVCGDFNSVPHSELYKLIVMGHLVYEGIPGREISGQELGYNRYSGTPLSRHFLPAEVGISDNLQYCNVACDRYKHHDFSVFAGEQQGTGVLRHNLRLVSAYQHWCKRQGGYFPEISTHHGHSNCNVDYIFYGVQSGMVRFHDGEVQTKDVQEGHLNLLGRFGLLTERELSKRGSLPNRDIGSDHLALIAKFLFT